MPLECLSSTLFIIPPGGVSRCLPLSTKNKNRRPAFGPGLPILFGNFFQISFYITEPIKAHSSAVNGH